MPTNYILIENEGSKVNNVLKESGEFNTMEEDFFLHTTNAIIDHPDLSITISKFVQDFLTSEVVKTKFGTGSITTEKLKDGIITSSKFAPEATVNKATYAEKTKDGKDLIQQFAEIFLELQMYYKKEEVDKMFNIITKTEEAGDKLQIVINKNNELTIGALADFELVKTGTLPESYTFDNRTFSDNINAMKLFTEEGDILILDDGQA